MVQSCSSKLKTVVMQDLILSETGSPLIFLKWIAPKWEWGENLNKDVWMCLSEEGNESNVVMKRGNHDVHS